MVTRNIRKLAVGQVVYTAICNETGGMIDDATVFRLAENNFRFIGGDEYDGVWLREQADAPRPAGVESSPPPTSSTTSPCRARTAATLMRELIWTAAHAAARSTSSSGSAS